MSKTQLFRLGAEFTVSIVPDQLPGEAEVSHGQHVHAQKPASTAPGAAGAPGGTV